MKVVTLDEKRFAEACRKLWLDTVRGGVPDILLGIRTGGYTVASSMALAIDPERTTLLPITKRRSSTAAKAKNPWIGWTLKRLPYLLTDRLRVLEHRIIAGKRAQQKTAASASAVWEPDPEEAARLTAELSKHERPRVLVVDDALDTGATLQAVQRFILSAAPQAELRSAVLVCTTKTSIVKPDVSLYSDVLCRFPWSHDFAR